MKIATGILAFIIAFLIVQPALVYNESDLPSDIGSCTSNGGCTQKKSCGGEPESDDSNAPSPCASIFCNPFMSCICGNSYLVEKPLFTTVYYSSVNYKLIPQNDNRISSALSECWHPPEVIL